MSIRITMRRCMGIGEMYLTHREERVKILDRQNSSPRNYGIDLLRIVSMLMVVTLHVLYHGNILYGIKNGTIEYYTVWFIESCACCAVNCYAIISGYVGVSSKFRITSIVMLWIRVAFYSILITIILKICLPNLVGNGELVFSFFPVFTRQYWYFTSYFLLFFFMPFLNSALNTLSQNKVKVLVLFILLLTVSQPLSFIFFPDVFRVSEGYSTWWLMVLYFACISITWISKFTIQYITTCLFGEARYDDMFFKYYSITVLLSAVFLFLVFERLTIKKSKKLVVFLSPLSFSVYLIHDNVHIRDNIMTKFEWISKLPLFPMLLSVLFVVIGIYLICSIIDWIRAYLFRLIDLKDKISKIEIMIKNRLRLKE